MYRTETVSGNKNIEGAVMSQQALDAPDGVPFEHKSGKEAVETRFGKIIVNYDNPTHMEKGMLGMPEKHYFCMVDFPVKKFSQFKMLQSLEDHQLSFIVLPLPLKNDIIDESDLLEASEDLGYKKESVAVYLIVNVYREANYVRMSVNARAPLFVDTSNNKAEQCVLRNNKYMVRQMLSGDAGKPVSKV